MKQFNFIDENNKELKMFEAEAKMEELVDNLASNVFKKGENLLILKDIKQTIEESGLFKNKGILDGGECDICNVKSDIIYKNRCLDCYIESNS